jgi:hypothetical protein
MKINKYQITPHKNCSLLVMQYGNSSDWISLKAGVPKEVAGILLGVNPDSLPGKPTGQFGGVTCVPLQMDVEARLPFKFLDMLTVESARLVEQ